MERIQGVPPTIGHYWVWDELDKCWEIVQVWECGGKRCVSLHGIDVILATEDVCDEVFLGPIEPPPPPPQE